MTLGGSRRYYPPAALSDVTWTDPAGGQPHTVDLNTILAAANIVVCASTVAAYLVIGSSDYINGDSIALAGIFAAVNQVALLIERRKRDPFVVLLNLILVPYFSLRILSLTVLPASVTFDRFTYDVHDTNAALAFMILANLSLYAGLYLVRWTESPTVGITDSMPRAPQRAVWLVALTVLFLYSRGVLWDAASLPRVLQVLLVFASQSIVLLMALAYYLLFRRRLTRTTAVLLIGLFMLEVTLHTLSGSRSAIVYMAQNILIVLLAVFGYVRIPRLWVGLGVLVMPIVMVFLVASFLFSTVVRATTASNEALTITRAYGVARTAIKTVDRDYVLGLGLPIFFSRIGFFDFSAEAIAHAHEYAEVVNVTAYAKSVVDNFLTPGFDVFDQPRIANSLKFAYENLGPVSRSASALAYQSDQLGIYGELFLLFGYASLPLFLIVAYLFKRHYMSIADPNPFRRTMRRVVVLTIFASFINSFGIDWLLMDAFALTASIYLYAGFFASRSARAAGFGVPVTA